jgi:hypothetical protein
MLPATVPALLAHLTRRRRACRPQEPADMGTAFGMEQWLDSCASTPAPEASRGRRAWLPRWLRGTAR